MKRLLFVAAFALLHIAASAQLGNEWIDFSAPYYKVAVGKDGVYRLSRTNLIAAGIPSFVNPKTFKLFHRGVEQAIFVEGENDSQLNTNDFIEFFGKANDGTLDQRLYSSADAQPHQLYNLFSDTTAYFLTYGGSEGKRSITSSSSSSPGSAETFHWDEKTVINHTEYSAGLDYGEIQLSGFEAGEGWTGGQISQNQTADIVVTGINNVVTSGELPKLEVVLTGRSPSVHNIEISAGTRLISTIALSGYNSTKFESDLAWADISPTGQFTLRVRVFGNGGLPARASVGYVKIIYPQSTTFDGLNEKFFTLTENPLDLSLIKLQSPPPNAVLYDVTDANNVKRLAVTQGTTLDAIVEGTSSKRKLFATSIFSAPAIKRIKFRSINPSGQNYVIVTHPSLRKPVAGYTDPVKALAEYRSLPQGGGYDTLVVNIDQLYNQFSYGETTPLAIFNFLKYLKTGKLPDYLFLIGKGLNINYGYHRNQNSFAQYKDLVPTAGYPASDMRFSAGLSGLPNVPAVATGRLSAIGAADVAAYFNKLKEFESSPFDNLKRKDILHLSGGLYENEPQLYRSYLEDYAAIAKSVYLGGNVKAIAKRSTDIEVINVSEELNKGLNLITLFGHSSPASADFDIGLVTDPLMGYNNKGKYPALLLNGCLAGSYFLNGSILGENWTNTPDRGAVGVIAHSFFGFPAYLKIYSEYFYRVAYGDSLFINKGLGDVQKEVAKRFITDYGNTAVPESQTQQMVLLGDPALSLFGARKPDFAILSNSVTLSAKDNSRLSALSDSLVLKFIVNNYGKAKDKSIRISVDRTLNDNSVVSYDTVLKATLYSDTIAFQLPGQIDNGFGNNNFVLKIDSDNTIDELNESNNEYAQVFFIPLSGTKNLYPDAFAIVNSTTPTLSFQHTDQLSGKRQFILQLDTTKEFSSSFKQSFQIEAQVLASQKVQLLTKDSLVYYWRTKLAQPEANESTEWETSSFTYIDNGPSGWAQISYGQLEDNFMEGLERDAKAKKIEFTHTLTGIDVTAYGSSRTEATSVKINGVEYNLYNEENNFQCRQNTINLIAFDRTTTQPYPGLYFTWLELRDIFGGAALLCGREPYVINSFRSNEVAMGNSGDLIHYIDNVAAGDSVLIFTIGDAGFSSWPAAAKTKMAELGVSVSQLDALENGEPVVIFGRKGSNAGTAVIHSTQNIPATAQSLSVSGSITGRSSKGSIRTALIGPALEWHDFLVNYKSDNNSDVVSFSIEGIDLLGNGTLLFDNITTDKSLTSLDAEAYPYLKITFSTEDETFVTAATLKRWMVTYEPVAEGLLMYRGSQEMQTVSEGETWTGNYRFINISEKSFQDSLVVHSEISRSNASSTTASNVRIMAPQPHDTTDFSVTFSTRHQAGINNLFVNVNPKVEPENDFDNNFITLIDHLKVLSDTLDPVLEVTFDGRFIADQEYVSPKPEIKIVLFDGNPFLHTKDTTNVKLYIKRPCENEACVFAPLYFSSAEISWTPENESDEFVVFYRPSFDIDGVYTLKVEARDASGNPSGTKPYEISFNVLHQNGINVYAPFPNPFTYKTNFQVDVIGEEIPESIEINIYNATGEVVRNFTNQELGTLHIGTNLFSWTGLSEKGMTLPNGFYLFRIKIKSSGVVAEKSGKIILNR